MKSMCKHWGLHISTDIDHLEVILSSFWAVWRGLLLSLEPKLRSWQFLRYWWFNKWYHGGYQLICLISRPLVIASRRDWYRSKGLLKGFKLALRPCESLKNWWRHGQMKFVTPATFSHQASHPTSTLWPLSFVFPTSISLSPSIPLAFPQTAWLFPFKEKA